MKNITNNLKDPNYCYKGIYYFYNSDSNVWYLFNDWFTGFVFSFNADFYRLDQCFNYVFNEIKREY